MLKLTNFILSNLDKNKAVLLALIDFSKAYNRQSHNRLLTCYSDLGTPPYLLKVLSSYLKNRKMIVRHNGALSDVFDLPGGGCQGTNLVTLSFLVYVNSCGVPLDGLLKCVCSSHTGDLCHPLLPIPDPHISNKYARFKYIDDLAAAEAVATSDLEVIPHEMPRPLEYRDRTLHHYPKEKSVLQKILLQIDDFCDAQQMVINEK